MRGWIFPGGAEAPATMFPPSHGPLGPFWDPPHQGRDGLGLTTGPGPSPPLSSSRPLPPDSHDRWGPFGAAAARVASPRGVASLCERAARGAWERIERIECMAYRDVEAALMALPAPYGVPAAPHPSPTAPSLGPGGWRAIGRAYSSHHDPMAARSPGSSAGRGEGALALSCDGPVFVNALQRHDASSRGALPRFLADLAFRRIAFWLDSMTVPVRDLFVQLRRFRHWAATTRECRSDRSGRRLRRAHRGKRVGPG